MNDVIVLEPQPNIDPTPTPQDDEWGELNLADSQVVTTPAKACRIGDPECESCQ
jgi:hypothetical protein